MAGGRTSSPAQLRWASRTQFFASGFIFATWGVHVPTIKVHYGVDEGLLGLAMLAAGIGALFGLTQASRGIARYGAQNIAALCGGTYALLLAGLLATPSFSTLLAVLAVFGAATSVFDVAINTEAALLEAREARPLMSGMHGMFSLGGMAGAMTGGAALESGLPPQWHLTLTALAMLIVIVLAARWMLPRTRTLHSSSHGSFRLPRGTLAVLGILAALGLIAEGAIYDWSVLYLIQELHSSPQQAALAYASFSAAMAATRFGGDAMRARWAPSVLLRGSALLAAASMTLVLLASAPWQALLGFAGVGIGFANVVPILFAASARVPGVEPARGIAGVSAAAYLGFMAGPPAIGFLARLDSLTTALCVVVVFAVALASSSRYADPA